MQKYILKAAEFYIGYVTRGPSSDVQIQGTRSWGNICRSTIVSIVFHLLFASYSLGGQDGTLKSPGVSRGSQRFVIDGLSEKSSVVAEPWERLLDLLTVVGARCEWQGDKGQRSLLLMGLFYMESIMKHIQEVLVYYFLLKLHVKICAPCVCVDVC